MRMTKRVYVVVNEGEVDSVYTDELEARERAEEILSQGMKKEADEYGFDEDDEDFPDRAAFAAGQDGYYAYVAAIDIDNEDPCMEYATAEGDVLSGVDILDMLGVLDGDDMKNEWFYGPDESDLDDLDGYGSDEYFPDPDEYEEVDDEDNYSDGFYSDND